ncbi:MAG TPA: ATP-binding protein [Planctomycetota bacterium]|nr:ATP-binding protein [Planctomycetota bacterium]
MPHGDSDAADAGASVAEHAGADERLRAYQDGIPHLSWTAAPDGSIDFCNRRWLEYTGRSAEELLGDRWLAVLHPEDKARHLAEWDRAMRSGSHYEQELRLRRADGEWRWHSVRDWPSRDANGTITHWYGTATDIHDQRLLAEERRETEEKLRAANEELEQFAGIASHDLQEPLRMVVSYLNLLRRRSEGKFDDQDRHYLDQVIDGTTRMQRLIKHLLDYAKMGRTELNLEPLECADPLNEALHLLGPRLKAAGGSVTHDPLPAVIGDRQQLVRLFQNLIGNAVKYRRNDVEPHVHVSAERRAGFVEVSIRDNGIGIKESDRRRIFDPFTRLHTRQEFAGTGLGLAICKRIIDRHGGEIRVESQPGSGSTFSFSLRAA